jgi:hypothetical protein
MGTAFWNFRGGLQGSLLCNQVLDNSIRYAPPDEIQLRYGRRKTHKRNALGTTKGVEEFLRVTIEAGLVCYMDREKFSIGRGISHVPILCIVRYKPFQITQRNTLPVRKDIFELF